MNQIIHMTDLFHPHEDPDDHWDLACQYALAYMKQIDLTGIIIDYPRINGPGDPAIQAVGQLNYITDLFVPVSVGIDPAESESLKSTAAEKFIFDTLKNSDTSVAIHIVGSCKDIAAAIEKRPDLFRNKCRAIYLNAGSSSLNSPIEYNVGLDPLSFSKLFSAPCPLYWMPCFEVAEFPFQIGTYSTFYKFVQGDILRLLSTSLQHYFLYALSRSDAPWLSYLNQELDISIYKKYYAEYRNMWCTGGIIHSADMNVLENGDIVPLENYQGQNLAFDFLPIEATCDNRGIVSWELTDKSTNQYIYSVSNTKSYGEAMLHAMSCLLKSIP